MREAAPPRYLDKTLARSNTSMRDKVRLRVSLGISSAELVAQQPGVDHRQVHEHLSREVKDYSAIVNAVRVDLVTRYVENRERPISDVGTSLGFSSLSAFSRWFRGQFGASSPRLRVDVSAMT